MRTDRLKMTLLAATSSLVLGAVAHAAEPAPPVAATAASNEVDSVVITLGVRARATPGPPAIRTSGPRPSPRKSACLWPMSATSSPAKAPATTCAPVTAEAVASQQEVADVFARAGLIPKAVDVRPLWDNRFNPILEQKT